MAEGNTADAFLTALHLEQSDEELEKIHRYFKLDKGEYGEGDHFIGVRMGTVFDLAKTFVDMTLDEIETLLESDIHEARAGAIKIMSLQAAHKKIIDEHRKALFDLYLRRHDRINNWDLVDLGAPNVIGRYVEIESRTILYDLARSDNLWKRRTAVVCTLHLIRQGDLDDIVTLAEMLLDDEEDLMHKAVGGHLREAGKHDQARLLAFLDQHAVDMPRTMLRYAIEKLDKDTRAHYRALKKST